MQKKICRKNRRERELRMAKKENANSMSYSDKRRGVQRKA